MKQSNFYIIQQKLNRFIRKYYLRELVKGFVWFILLSFFYLFITALVENFLWLPPQGRRYLYYAQWIVLSLFFVFFIASPLLKLFGFFNPISQEQAARIIGNYFPEIKDKLLNTIQLHNQKHTSDLLVAGVSQRVSEFKIFNFGKALDFKKVYKFIPLLLLPFLIFLLLKIFHYDTQISQSYQRVLSYRSEFHPPVPFKVNLMGKQNVIKGNDLKIKVKLTGDQFPDKLFILIDDDNILMQKENDSIFSFYFPMVQKPVNFSIVSPKYRFGPFHISLIHPPQILQLKTILKYPAYLHRKPETFLHTTNLTVPENTLIQWKLETSDTDSLYVSFNDSIHYYKIKNDRFSLSKRAKQSFEYKFQPVNAFLKDFEQYSNSVSVIRDQYPVIKVMKASDSIHMQNYHKILATDDYGIYKLSIFYKISGDTQYQHENIPITPSDLVQSNYIFPGTLPLTDGKTYEYYFRCYDNDAPHGYKTARSKTFYYNKLSADQIQGMQLQQQKQSVQDFSRLQQRFSKQNRKINRFTNQMTQQKSMDFQSKKQLENTLQDLDKQEQFFKQAIKKYKDLLKRDHNKDNEFNKELQKRLDELQKLNKKKKLLDELKKLAEKLKKEDLISKLKDLEKYSEHQEKSLERILELTKKYYMQQKMQKMSDKLDELSQKQDSLSRTNKDTKQAQDDLNKQMDSLQKQADSLQKMNEKLKNPMKTPDMGTEMEDIKQDMKQASEKLSQQQANPANSKQSKAASKMKQLAKDMKMAMSGGGEQNEEDIATLQALLKSLLYFSFNEESLIKDLYEHSGKTHLSQQLLQQNKLKVFFKHINDSLYTLALRNPKISQYILEEAYEINSSLDKTLDALSENQSYLVNSHAQYILKGSNKLANFLSNALDQMKNPMPSMGQGKGKKGKGKGFSLPDIIKKQGQSISQMQDALKKKKGDGKKNGEGKPKQQKGKKEGQGGGEQESAKQYQLYKQQQQIKESLQQLGDKFSDQATKKRIQDLAKKMDQLQNKILREGITQNTLNRMIQLQHELLKLKNATFTQHQDNQRQSRTNYKQFSPFDTIFMQNKQLFLPEIELLKRSQIPVNQKVKQKIKQYLY